MSACHTILLSVRLPPRSRPDKHRDDIPHGTPHTTCHVAEKHATLTVARADTGKGAATRAEPGRLPPAGDGRGYPHRWQDGAEPTSAACCHLARLTSAVRHVARWYAPSVPRTVGSAAAAGLRSFGCCRGRTALPSQPERAHAAAEPATGSRCQLSLRACTACTSYARTLHPLHRTPYAVVRRASQHWAAIERPGAARLPPDHTERRGVRRNPSHRIRQRTTGAGPYDPRHDRRAESAERRTRTSGSDL
jgi:hypothetical protein